MGTETGSYHESIKGEIARRVVDVVYESLGLDSGKGQYSDKSQIGMETVLSEDLDTDSLDITELAINIGDAFNITIHERDAKFGTIKDIVDYVANWQKKRR